MQDNTNTVDALPDKIEVLQNSPFARLHEASLSYQNAFNAGISQFSNLELAKQRASYIKWKSLESLDKYLVEFESNFIKHGGKVIWAQNTEECNKEILEIIKRTKAKQIFKSKSITLDEIKLREFLASNSIKVSETDLGDFIQAADNETSSHFVLPAIHKSKEEVVRALKKVFPEINNEIKAEELTKLVRNYLRKDFPKIDIGITGANFIIAENGSVSVSENEGNVLLTANFPKVHIVVAGIEKVLPALNDLDLMLALLASHGTGQNITTYNTLYSGPRQSGEVDGPEEMYVILLDNNRTNLLAEADQREALGCIHCGACLNVCPVYTNLGGHAYRSVYNGPIGSIVSPYLETFEKKIDLSDASTLCGSCTDICPVKINLHKLLLNNRMKKIDNKVLPNKKENWAFYIWKKAMLKRSSMNQGGTKTKNFLLQKFFKKGWGPKREFPKIAPKSFNEMWKEQNPHIYKS